MSARRPPLPLAGTLLRALIIAAVATWAFWPAQRGTYLWDDELEILHNPWVRDPSGWWRAWVSPAGLDYFPLKDTVHWLQWRGWGSDVFGYHLCNLGLHICAAWLVWRVLGKLGTPQAWVGGLLFAIHPLAVESVAWMAELKNTLSLPPLLLALSAFLDYDEHGRKRDLVGAVAWFAAAMLCKTSVVMLPVFLVVYLWWHRRRVGLAELRGTVPFFVISLLLGLVTVFFQTHRAMRDVAPNLAWPARLIQAGWNLLAYLRAGFLPTNLAPVYEPATPATGPWVPWLLVGALLFLFWLRRAGWGRHALLGSAWILLNLLPVLGLVPLSYTRVAAHADHLAYIALVGIVGLAAAAFGAAWNHVAPPGRLPRGLLAAAGVGLLLLAVSTTHAYAAIFVDSGTLWRAAVTRAPHAWLARSNLGRVLMEEGNAEGARAQFLAAKELQPDSAEVRANLGTALESLGQGTQAEEQYRAAIALNPQFAGAHYDLGRTLLQAGRPQDAVLELKVCLELDPTSAPAHNNLGLAWAQLGRLGDAMTEYQTALRLDPARPEVYVNLGNANVRLNHLETAVGQYRVAIKLNPRYGAAHRNLAMVLHALGQEQEAAAELAAARANGIP